MPERYQPNDLAAAPVRYPEPDYEAVGRVTRVYVPDDGTVGYALWQDPDRIAWISWVDADHLGYGIRLHVGALLRDNARAGVPARETWERLLLDTLHTPARDEFLPAVLADIHHEIGG